MRGIKKNKVLEEGKKELKSDGVIRLLFKKRKKNNYGSGKRKEDFSRSHVDVPFRRQKEKGKKVEQ